MATIEIHLPADRTQLGTLTLKAANGTVIAGPFQAYGKAANDTAAQHGNAGADPLHLYGDTPLGSYSFSSVVATGANDASGQHPTHKYGDNGAIAMTPASGDAQAAAANGRTGLMIHGGDLDAQGRFRRTNGCVRLSNDDVQSLVTSIGALGGDALTTITVQSSNLGGPSWKALADTGAPDENDENGVAYDEGDPPSGAGPIGVLKS